MSRRVGLYGEPKAYRAGGGAKASLIRAFSRTGQTRNLVIYRWAGWRAGNTAWRTERVIVEKICDDLTGGLKV